ncbi:hypothetical protein JANAI62_14090 [Jannaschia pagri]|uniref:Uncharacterized protein n=1 Tax=Jannaschia pagri TaxID=2829797 RepID=A0ABQ4NKB2_9RHOB|nr:hypothetical protein JANAI62_14090 [Jannaschia sp. AI_62]
MDFAPDENVGQGAPDQFAHAQLPLRGAAPAIGLGSCHGDLLCEGPADKADGGLVQAKPLRAGVEMPKTGPNGSEAP